MLLESPESDVCVFMLIEFTTARATVLTDIETSAVECHQCQV